MYTIYRLGNREVGVAKTEKRGGAKNKGAGSQLTSISNGVTEVREWSYTKVRSIDKKEIRWGAHSSNSIFGFKIINRAHFPDYSQCLAVAEDGDGVHEEVICCSDCMLWAVSELRIVESTGSRHEGHVNDFRSHSSTHS